MFDPLGLDLESAPITSSSASLASFWRVFAERAGERPFKIGNKFSRWRALPQHELVVAQYVTGRGVGVFVRGLRGTRTPAVVRRLRPLERRLIEGLNAPVGDPTFPYNNRWPIDTRDRAAWPWLADWLHAQADRYAVVLDWTVRTGDVDRAG